MTSQNNRFWSEAAICCVPQHRGRWPCNIHEEDAGQSHRGDQGCLIDLVQRRVGRIPSPQVAARAAAGPARPLPDAFFFSRTRERASPPSALHSHAPSPRRSRPTLGPRAPASSRLRHYLAHHQPPPSTRPRQRLGSALPMDWNRTSTRAEEEARVATQGFGELRQAGGCPLRRGRISSLPRARPWSSPPVPLASTSQHRVRVLWYQAVGCAEHAHRGRGGAELGGEPRAYSSGGASGAACSPAEALGRWPLGAGGARRGRAGAARSPADILARGCARAAVGRTSGGTLASRGARRRMRCGGGQKEQEAFAGGGAGVAHSPAEALAGGCVGAAAGGGRTAIRSPGRNWGADERACIRPSTSTPPCSRG